MSRIVYLSGIRLPTEKAHGFQVMKMCEAMAELGHDVELLHPRRRQVDPALEGVDPFEYYGVKRSFGIRRLANVDVVRLEQKMPAAAFRGVFTLHEMGWGMHGARRAVQSGPDLIFTREPALAWWASRLGRACAFEAHVPPTGRRGPMIRSFARRPSTRAVFALTSFTAADLKDAGVPSDKLGVLPDAADLSAFTAAPARDEARKRLGLATDRTIVGYIGRFQTMGKEKGIRELIQAFADPEVQALDPLLLCVGGPMDAVPGYLEYARELGVPESMLRFEDRVANADVPVWLSALDIGAMPYPAAEHYATAMSPLKLFEYMAAGLPIVGTDLPAVREVLDDGGNALLVPPDDHVALAGAIRRLLQDPELADRLGRQALKDAEEYTWQRRAERALDLALNGSR